MSSERHLTYGTDKSELLKHLIDGGHKPLGITIIACEETFIFQTKEELSPVIDYVNQPGSNWMNEGWWYAIEDDGDWPWEKAWKDYVNKMYNGDESKAPKIYWLDDTKIKNIKEWLKSK